MPMVLKRKPAIGLMIFGANPKANNPAHLQITG